MAEPFDRPPPPPPQPPAPPPRGEENTRPPPPKEPDGGHRPFWRELPVLIVIAFAIALLLKTFVVQAFYIPSASMEETLKIGDRVLVEKLGYRFSEPGRGHVVVFEKDLGTGLLSEEDDRSVLQRVNETIRGLFGFPTGTAQDFIKRVIAVGGDTVEGEDGRVFVNGEAVDEPYLDPGTETSSFGPVDVPEGMIFVMGDNRGNSDDSRNFGPVPTDTVLGRAFLLIWPPRDFATL